MRTQPIAIARNHNSHHLHHSEHHHHSNDNSNNSRRYRMNGSHHPNNDSDSEDDNNYAKAFFCESLNDLNTNMGGLTVGSLPSSRRERRFLVSIGTNESLPSSRGRAHYTSKATTTTSSSGGGIGGALARSMPPPKAPFLSSRRESDDRLKSMPNMDLPESATEYGNYFKGTPAAVMPYGSLRESRFHQRRVHDQPPRQLRGVRFDLEGNAAAAAGAPETLSSSYTGDGFYPHSLPVNKFEQNIIQKRWETLNKNKRDNLLDSSNHSDATQDHDNHSSKALGTGGGGIGSLLESSSIATETSQTFKARNDKPVGNLSSQLEGHNSQISCIPTTEKNNAHDPDRIIDKSGPEQNFNNGTTKTSGSLENTLANSSFTSSKQSNRHQNSINDTFSLSQDTDSSIPHASNSSLLGSELITPDDSSRQQQLSTSLTGLEILEFSRGSPGGLGVNLTKAEKDGLMMFRARTYSDDTSKILNNGNKNFVSSPASLEGRQHFYSQNHRIPPETLLSHPPNLLPPANYNREYPNLHHNHTLDDSYDNISSSPQNPDTEGAFDLDFE